MKKITFVEFMGKRGLRKMIVEVIFDAHPCDHS